jgi:hypothetical protein
LVGSKERKKELFAFDFPVRNFWNSEKKLIMTRGRRALKRKQVTFLYKYENVIFP